MACHWGALFRVLLRYRHHFFPFCLPYRTFRASWIILILIRIYHKRMIADEYWKRCLLKYLLLVVVISWGAYFKPSELCEDFTVACTKRHFCILMTNMDHMIWLGRGQGADPREIRRWNPRHGGGARFRHHRQIAREFLAVAPREISQAFQRFHFD